MNRHMVAKHTVIALAVWCLPFANINTMHAQSKYLVVILPSGQQLTWTQARDAAECMYLDGTQGHLVTITTEEENNHVFELACRFCITESENQRRLAQVKAHEVTANRLWLGGYQYDEKNEPAGGWGWVTRPSDEPWKYTNWRPNSTKEPNNEYGGGYGGLPEKTKEEALHFAETNAPTWNDLPTESTLRGFIVEFDGLAPRTVVDDGK